MRQLLIILDWMAPHINSGVNITFTLVIADDGGKNHSSPDGGGNTPEAV